MSRSSQRPPRCPFQNKGSFNVDAIGPTTRLHRFNSQESYFEEQPLWIDDLLGESEMSPRGALRRSASDSAAILDVLSEDFNDPDGEILPDSEDRGGVELELEGTCVYGPNSPRHKSNLTQSESAIVSAFWENVPQLQFQSSDSNPLNIGETHYPNVYSNQPIPPGDFASERASRRHYGQRSRVRKLQYIAELERTVSVFQTLEADLAVKVASLYQRRAILYEENSTLKQRIASLRKEKMIKDGQHQYLKNELKRMKAVVGHHRKTKSSSSFQLDSFERVSLDATWQSLDMAKLSLG